MLGLSPLIGEIMWAKKKQSGWPSLKQNWRTTAKQLRQERKPLWILPKLGTIKKRIKKRQALGTRQDSRQRKGAGEGKKKRPTQERGASVLTLDKRICKGGKTVCPDIEIKGAVSVGHRGTDMMILRGRVITEKPSGQGEET